MLRLQALTGDRYEGQLLRGAGRVRGFDANASKALQALLAAQNQEEAGQWMPAVISYQTALKLGGEYVFPKAIGVHLDAIKAAHPTEHGEGTQRFLAAPAP